MKKRLYVKSLLPMIFALIFIISVLGQGFSVNAEENLPGPKQLRETTASAKGVVALAWDKVNGVSGYKVVWKVGTVKRSKTVQKPVANIVGVNPGKDAEVEVISLDANKKECGSTKVTVHGVPKTPAKPYINKWTPGSRSIELGWAEVKDATGYEVMFMTLRNKKITTVKVKKNELKRKINGIKDAGFKVKIRAYRELSNDIVRSGKTVTKKFTIYGNWCGTKCFVPQCNVSYKYDADGYMNISFDPIANASAYTVYVAYSNDYSHYYKLVTLDYDQTSVSSDLIDKGDRIIVLPTVRINNQSYAARIFDKAYYKNYDYCIVK